MDESLPKTISTENRLGNDTKDDVDGLRLNENSDHALQKERCTTSQLPSEGNVFNRPMYTSEDWEVLYELRSLDGRGQNICCLKAYVLYCVNSIRLKISKPKPMKTEDKSLFVIPPARPAQPLSENKPVSVTDVQPDIQKSKTNMFDARTDIIEKKRVFTFMSTVMNIPDASLMDFGEIKVAESKESVSSKSVEIVTSSSAGKIQQEKKQGRFLKIYQCLRRK